MVKVHNPQIATVSHSQSTNRQGEDMTAGYKHQSALVPFEKYTFI